MRRVYSDAIDNPNSFDRVPTYWLPTIRSLGVNVPVILIGNKSVHSLVPARAKPATVDWQPGRFSLSVNASAVLTRWVLILLQD